MKRLVTLALIAGLGTSMAAHTAQTTQGEARPKTATPANQPAMTDAAFIEKATAGGMKEVEAGKLASDKATNAEVKAFAQKMVTDHTTSNAELTKLAKSKNVVMKDHDAMEVKDGAPVKHATADLAGLTGAAFDRAYMAQMVKDHQAALELFENKARDGKDADVKGWANQKLPAMRTHLKMAKDLHAKVK